MDMSVVRFRLDDRFVAKFAGKQPEWGQIGYITYKRTYSRALENIPKRCQKLAEEHEVKTSEEYWLTLVRVIEGCYHLQEAHCKDLHLPWNPRKAQRSAQEMYRLMWEFKFLPPGRGMWMMGTDRLLEKAASLNNCAMCSTIDLKTSFSDPFCFLMDMSMLGVGVGGDTRGAGTINIREPRIGGKHVVEDSREGWVELIRRVLDSYVGRDTFPENIDYSQVRPSGTPIRGFGGTACLTGETLLYLDDHHKGKNENQITIEELYDTKQNTTWNWESRNILIRSLDEKTGSFFRNKVIDIYDNGTAEVFEITTRLGYSIKATSNHRFLDSEGRYKYLENFSIGEDIAINGAKERKTGTCIDCGCSISRRAIRCKPCFDVYQIRDDALAITARQRKENRDYLKLHPTCELCGNDEFSTREHYIYVHHRDRNALNNNHYNLQTLCARCHNKTHAKEDHLGSPYEHRYLNFDNIVSIQKQGYERVFDLQMEAPFHNFVANGFVSHNSGPEPLIELVESLEKLLDKLVGEAVTSTAIVDIFNLIGRCVVAGNLRRTAEIMFGEPDDIDFLELKDPKVNKKALDHHRWASNNSIFAILGMNYKECAERTAKNGEPGYFWLENARKYSRTKDPADYKDVAAAGGNPCLEQTLESFELCNLVETFPAKHSGYEEFQRTLKFAYLYAKTVTLVHTHDARTNAVMLRNRRIGTSMSGIAQAFKIHGRRELFSWCDQGYDYLKRLDGIYSRWLCIPESIKITSLKPSGTISLLPGATPGIHNPHSEYYHRVIRFASDSPLIEKLRAAGYQCVEIDPKKEPNTTAVYFPIKEEHFDRSKSDVSMWEQLENAAQMQYWWADNQVSCTITFNKEEAAQIPYALELYEHRLKGISFLPLKDHGYEHAPYQEITKKEYKKAITKLKPLDLSEATNEVIEKFCSSDSCSIIPNNT